MNAKSYIRSKESRSRKRKSKSLPNLKMRTISKSKEKTNRKIFYAPKNHSFWRWKMKNLKTRKSMNLISKTSYYFRDI